MSLISVVIDKARIRDNGESHLKIVRLIVAFEDAITGQVTIDSKYIYYPIDEFVADDFCFKFNGITSQTVATRGEKYTSVIDWFRGAARGKRIVTCSKTDMAELLGETPCHLFDLHDFFYTKSENKVEPISLARLCSRMFNDNSWLRGERDAFNDCRSRLAMYHVMQAFRAIDRQPPFQETFFPKIQKRYTAGVVNQARKSDSADNWENPNKDEKKEAGSSKGNININRHPTYTNLTEIDSVEKNLSSMSLNETGRNKRKDLGDAASSENSRGGRSTTKVESDERLILKSADRLSYVYSLITESKTELITKQNKTPVRRYLVSVRKYVSRKFRAIVSLNIESSSSSSSSPHVTLIEDSD